MGKRIGRVSRADTPPKRPSVRFMSQAAMTAAIYVVLTLMGAAYSFGEVQLRIAEALCVLPVYTSAAVPGLFLGCLLGNILGGAVLPDIVFGSLATLIGAFFTWRLRDKNKFVSVLPPMLSNALIIPFILKYAYMLPFSVPFMMLTVGAGEILSCGVLGLFLRSLLDKYKEVIFTR